MAVLAEQKNTEYQASTWPAAAAKLKEFGVVHVNTGGGDDWNENVRERLARDSGLNVVFTGTPPGYNKNSGFYRYIIEVTNNRQASMLLSKTEDD